MAVIRKHIVVFSPGLSAAHLERLAAQHEVHDFSDRASPFDDADFIAALAQAHGLIGVRLAWTAERLALAPQLEALSSISVGVDNYDTDTLEARAITLCHTPDVLTETTADTAFALILATARRVVELASRVRNGQWQTPTGPAEFGVDVHHKQIGIVGMGRIGAAIARRAHFGFAMPVAYHNRSRAPALEAELDARYMTFDEVLADSDFVVATVPLGPTTENLFDAHAFAQMKPGAIFINIARGAVVDEAALVDALDNGPLRAAGLDVFRGEPIDANNPLAGRDDIVALPHIGSATVETRAAMADLAVDNLLAALAGKTPTAVFTR